MEKKNLNTTYNPKDFEKRIYEHWLKKDYFTAKVNPDKKENLKIIAVLYGIAVIAGLLLEIFGV